MMTKERRAPADRPRGAESDTYPGEGKIRTVVLVNPPMRPEQVYGSFSEWGSISPPTGMCYIAAVLRQAGYEVAILDAEALRMGVRETVDAVVEHRPQIVGIACKTLWVVNAHKVAKALKEKMPHVPIVAGGNHVTALPQRSLEDFPAFDVVVVGEGERTFLELIQTLNAGGELRAVAGLGLREGDGAVLTAPRERIRDLDELPMPAYDLLPDVASYYQPPLNTVQKVPAFSLVTSRGCPCQCAFCDRSVFGRCVTTHSPEYTVELIRKVRDDYGIRYLLFDDDNLLLNKRHLFRLLDLMEQAGLHIPFSCQSRVDTLSEEKLARLKKARCRMILFGVEAGSQAMLDAMKKGITTDQVRQAIAMTRKAGIKASGFFILGYPGETEQTMDETVQLIKECKFYDVGVFLFTPLPGSEIYAHVRDYGTFDEDWEKMNAMDEVVFTPTGLTAEKLMAYSDRCYKACYSRPGQVLSAFGRITSMAHFKAVLKSVPKILLPKAS